MRKVKRQSAFLLVCFTKLQPACFWCIVLMSLSVFLYLSPYSFMTTLFNMLINGSAEKALGPADSPLPDLSEEERFSFICGFAMVTAL